MPRSYTELSSFFGPLEHFAQSCGNDEAGNLLRFARISFNRDFAFKPRRRQSSSSSVKLYRSTAALVDLQGYGHCSFSMGGVKMRKAQQHQSVIILQRQYYCGA